MRRGKFLGIIVMIFTLALGVIPISRISAEQPTHTLNIHVIDEDLEEGQVKAYFWNNEGIGVPEEHASSNWDEHKRPLTKQGEFLSIGIPVYEGISFKLGLILLNGDNKFIDSDTIINIDDSITDIYIDKNMNYVFEDPNTEIEEPGENEEDVMRIHFTGQDIDLSAVTLWTWDDFKPEYITSNWGKDNLLQSGVDGEFIYFDVPLKADAKKIGFLFYIGDGSTEILKTVDYRYTLDDENRNIYINKGDDSVYHSPDMKNSDINGAMLVSDHDISFILGNNHGLDNESIQDNFKLTKDGNNIPYTVVEILDRSALVRVDEKVDIKSDWRVQFGVRSLQVFNDWQYMDENFATEKSLGQHWEGDTVVLNFWSPSATNVTAVFYDEGNQDTELVRIAMTETDNVWNLTVSPSNLSKTNLENNYYQYLIERDGEELFVLDPYAPSMASWNGLNKEGCTNNQATCVGKAALVDIKNTGTDLNYASIEGFESSEDAIIYEVHVRDFTSDLNIESELENPFGTFKSFVEKLDYIESLGVTHIQLLPVSSYYNIDESNNGTRVWDNTIQGVDSNYNWGYDPHSYFSLTGEYSVDSNNAKLRVEEYKEMINEIHNRGMGVIMDVVYNHTARVNIFEDLEPNYYHFMDKYGVSKTSFGGGRLGTTHDMASRVLVDSITYWTQEYKIDGFRFDMMGDHDADSIQRAYDSAASLNPKTLFLGEGWVTYAGDDDHTGIQAADQSWMKYTDDVGVFSDEVRNELKSGFGSEGEPRFLTGGARNINTIFNNIKAQPGNFTADSPQDVITYIEAHDNLTLYDVIAQSIKKDPKDYDSEILARQRLGNFMVLTSQGTAFLHSGQEYGKTRQVINDDYINAVESCPASADTPLHKSTCMVSEDGNPFEYPYFIHDAYNSSDKINRFDWEKVEDSTLYPENNQTVEYTKGLIELRRSEDGFTLDSKDLVDSNVKLLNLTNQSSEDLILGYTIDTEVNRYYVFINADDTSRALGVDYNTLQVLKKAEVLVDKESAGVSAITNPQGIEITSDITLDALSGYVLKISQEDLMDIEYTKNNNTTIDQGTILHAWNWSYEAIEDNLEEIKKAGYTAVQTSPVQPSKESGTLTGDKWWLLYQPIDFTIGNTLGTKEEFTSMVNKANDIGVEVIVDVVLNHLGNNGGGDQQCVPSTNIKEELLVSEFWHGNGCEIDYSNRTQVTQNGIGLPDLNTSNKELQQIMINFLNEMEEIGVKGFRFDAAKHIELPNDSGVSSDFWPSILSSLNTKTYVYGEIIQDSTDEYKKYSEFLDTTATSYGYALRNALTTQNSAGLVNYQTNNVEAIDLVTWVESHDTYANDGNESTYLTDEELVLGWAILASRKENTPLFFVRPQEDKFAVNIGDTGSELWKDNIVTEVNNFHNAMNNQDEYIYTPTSDTIIVTRGTQGLVIVNLGDNPVHIHQALGMADGVYENTIDQHLYTISEGILDAELEGRSVVILMADENKPSISFTPNNREFYTETLDVDIEVNNATQTSYRINDGEWIVFDGQTTVNIGTNDLVWTEYTLEVKANNEYGEQIIRKVYKKSILAEDINIYFNKWEDWNTNLTMYYYGDYSEPASWPGQSMELLENGWYKFTITPNHQNGNVIFADGTKQYPGGGEPGIYVDQTVWIDGTQTPVSTNPQLDYAELDAMLQRYREEKDLYSARHQESLVEIYTEVISVYNDIQSQQEIDEYTLRLSEFINLLITKELESAINQLIVEKEEYPEFEEALEEIKNNWSQAQTQSQALDIHEALIQLIPEEIVRLDYSQLKLQVERFTINKDTYASKVIPIMENKVENLNHQNYLSQEEIDKAALELEMLLHESLLKDLEVKIELLFTKLYNKVTENMSRNISDLKANLDSIKEDWNGTITQIQGLDIYARLQALDYEEVELDYSEFIAVYKRYEEIVTEISLRANLSILPIFEKIIDEVQGYTSQEEIDAKVKELSSLLDNALTRVTEEAIEILITKLSAESSIEDKVVDISERFTYITTEDEGLKLLEELRNLESSVPVNPDPEKPVDPEKEKPTEPEKGNPSVPNINDNNENTNTNTLPSAGVNSINYIILSCLVLMGVGIWLLTKNKKNIR